MKKNYFFRFTNNIFYLLTIIIALVGLLGWTTDELTLAKFSPVYIPIAPSTSLSFVFLSIFSILLKGKIKYILDFFRISSLVFFIFFIYVVLEWIFSLSWDIENIFVSAPDSFGQVKIGRMSPLTAILFLFEFLTLLLLFSESKKYKNFIIWISIGITIYTSTILLVGYLYKEPVLYGGTIIPVALPTAVCFWLVSISQLLFSYKKVVPFPFLHITSTAKQLISVFLPLVTIVVFLGGFLNLTNFNIIVNHTLESALLLLVLFPVIVIITVYVSKSLGKKIEKANQIIERARDELDKVQKITNTGSWYLDIATNEVIWTEELYKMYGFDPNLPVPPYTEHMKLFTEESWELLSKSLAKTAETGIPYELELNTVKKDGSNGWMWVRGESVKDKNGIITGLWGAAKDITNDKNYEIQLKESYDLLHKLTSMVPGVVYQYRLYPDGRSAFPISSPGMWDIYEVTPEEVKEDASPVFTRLHPDDFDMIVRTINESAKNQTLYNEEFRVVLPKQGLRWRLCNAKPQLLEDGSTLWYGIITDITERKKIENEIIRAKELAENSEKRFQLYVNQSPSPLAVVDKNLELIVHWSQSATELTGHSPKTVDEWFKSAYPDPDYRKEVIKRWEQKVEIAVTTKKATNTGEYDITCKNGSVLTVEFYVQLIPDFFIITLNDVTKRKEAEIELIKAKEKAEEADRLKSAFLANMSHEIRTPMNGILGFTSLLKDHNLTGKQQQHYIDIITKSGDRLLNTVNDIIEISRIETGNIKISKTKTDIYKQLVTLYGFFSLEAAKKGLTLHFDNKTADEEFYIITDKIKLDSILTNLIKNAIKYTKEGTINFGYKKKKNVLEFYIKDTGIGIPAARQEAIFNRFEQADIEDKHVFEGSGLGLAIVKSYVEMLGGKIWVESEENKGSMFFFTLPHSSEIIIPIAENRTKKIESPKKSKSLNILIVEDDYTSSVYLSTILNKKTRNIQSVNNGLDAVEFCRNNPDLDLVLMDIKLPGLNGLTATKQIREFNKTVKIIAQTAHAIEGDAKKAKEAGCDAYISKPINKEELFMLIEKYC